MAKYYWSQLASRPLVFSGKTFRFLICAKVVGRSSGIYEATDPEEIAILDAAVAGKRGIKEIDAAEYEELKKKATLTLQFPKRGGSRPPRPVQIPMPPQLAIEKAGIPSAAGSGAVATADPETELASAPKIKDLIKIERVNPPKPFTVAAEKTVKASQRADRAKARIARPAVDSSSP